MHSEKECSRIPRCARWIPTGGQDGHTEFRKFFYVGLAERYSAEFLRKIIEIPRACFLSLRRQRSPCSVGAPRTIGKRHRVHGSETRKRISPLVGGKRQPRRRGSREARRHGSVGDREARLASRSHGTALQPAKREPEQKRTHASARNAGAEAALSAQLTAMLAIAPPARGGLRRKKEIFVQPTTILATRPVQPAERMCAERRLQDWKTKR